MRIRAVLAGLLLAALPLAAAADDGDAANNGAKNGPPPVPQGVPLAVRVKPGTHFHFLMVPEFRLEPAPVPPGATPPPCGLKRVQSYPMQLDGENHIVVPVMLDKPRLLEVDIGGIRSMLYSSAAKEMKLGPPEIDAGSSVGIAGDSSNQLVIVPDLSFGIVTFHHASFTLIEDSRPLPLADNAVAGVLGPSHLMTFDVEFDFGHSRLNLYAPDHCPGKVVYWAQNYVTVPFKLEGLVHIQFPMMLDGKSVSVTLDSGAPASVLNMTAAKELFGLDANSPGVEFAGYINDEKRDELRFYRCRFKSLSMNGIEIRNPTVFLMPDRMAAQTDDRIHLPQMILGLREMVSLHLYIAYDERVIYATAAEPQPPTAKP
ncbi:MAG TPA: aspartyl protease family protein [Rhizomicrobium sp.]|jgi:hypothetical protein